MTSQTRPPPISRLLILPCDLIFLRRLPASLALLQRKRDGSVGRRDLDDLGAGRRPVGHEVVVDRADAPLADLGPPLEVVDLGTRRLGPNLSAQFLLTQNTAHDQVSHAHLLLNSESRRQLRVHVFASVLRTGTPSVPLRGCHAGRGARVGEAALPPSSGAGCGRGSRRCAPLVRRGVRRGSGACPWARWRAPPGGVSRVVSRTLACCRMDAGHTFGKMESHGCRH